jgi:hypothetical protein
VKLIFFLGICLKDFEKNYLRYSSFKMKMLLADPQVTPRKVVTFLVKKKRLRVGGKKERSHFCSFDMDVRLMRKKR